jgi:hypothetical protein
MKITISMPKGVYEKLEKDRGLIPRSTYIQKLIGEGVKKGVKEAYEVPSSTEFQKEKPTKKKKPKKDLDKLIESGVVQKGWSGPITKGSQTSWKHVKKKL